jgi:multisubunit Na+/H+ antiporter MnhF subunit
MSLGEIAALVLLVGAFVPGMVMAGRGSPQRRIVGMEFATIAAAMALAVLVVAWHQSFALTVPLTLVVVTLPGTLVYTRLLVGPHK